LSDSNELTPKELIKIDINNENFIDDLERELFASKEIVNIFGKIT